MANVATNPEYLTRQNLAICKCIWIHKNIDYYIKYVHDFLTIHLMGHNVNLSHEFTMSKIL